MGPIWDTSGQPAYGLTHMGPMPNPGEQDFSSFSVSSSKCNILIFKILFSLRYGRFEWT